MGAMDPDTPSLLPQCRDGPGYLDPWYTTVSIASYPWYPSFYDIPEEGTGYVYLIAPVGSVTKKHGYVGISTRPPGRRLRDHVGGHSGCHAIASALKKHGRSAFTFTILKWGVKENDLPMEEMRMVEEFDTYHNGYNLTPGGEINPMNNPKTRRKHRAVMSSKEFIEKAAIKRNKTFKTKEYKERVGETHVRSWVDGTVDREKHRASIKAAWKRDHASRTATLQNTWKDPERRQRQLDGMKEFFAMKRDPSVTNEQIAEWRKKRARENAARSRDLARARKAGRT